MKATSTIQSVKLGDALYTLRHGELYDTDGQLLRVGAKSARMMTMLLGEPARAVRGPLHYNAVS